MLDFVKDLHQSSNKKSAIEYLFEQLKLGHDGIITTVELQRYIGAILKAISNGETGEHVYQLLEALKLLVKLIDTPTYGGKGPILDLASVITANDIEGINKALELLLLRQEPKIANLLNESSAKMGRIFTVILSSPISKYKKVRGILDDSVLAGGAIGFVSNGLEYFPYKAHLTKYLNVMNLILASESKLSPSQIKEFTEVVSRIKENVSKFPCVVMKKSIAASYLDVSNPSYGKGELQLFEDISVPLYIV